MATEAHAEAAEVQSPSQSAVKRVRPIVGYPVYFGVTPALRDLPAAPIREMKPDTPPREIINPSLAAKSRKPPIKRVVRQSADGDAAIYAPPAPTPMDPPLVTFEGVNNLQSQQASGLFVSPPDTNGDVGPNHYVQTVNLAMRVFNKNGTPATPVFLMSSLFPSGPCSITDDGDPIALYDQLANRWLISQFQLAAFPNPPYYQCIAISQTGDPTGPYYAYTYLMPGNNLNDYPHFGVWHDAYYMTDNQFLAPALSFNGGGNFAFDRLKMLAGDPTASFIYFNGALIDPNLGGLLPSDLDGPPRVRPNVFAAFTANEFGDPTGDGLRMFEFVPNFATPASSTFTELPFLPVAAFDPVSPSGRTDIPQPGTTSRVDSIDDRLMYRLQYRNYGTRETLVVAHTVDVSGDTTPAVYRAGVRYYELQRPLPAGGNWTIREQSTYAPADTVNRWMPSAAMDNDGNLAVGFSVSDAVVFPGIRYAGRLAGDPTGLVQGEATLQAGTGSQGTASPRWGDYSMLAVDPVDDCTFWFTTEYYTPAPGPGCTGGASGICWQTRVGSFKFASCTPPAGGGTITGTVTDSVSAAPISGATVSATGGFVTTTNASGVYTMSVPAGTYDVTASKAGYASATATGQVVTTGGTTTVNLALMPLAILTFVSRTIDDSAGNGNGNVDPNECIATVVTLRNDGSAPATGITGTLTTSTPNVTVTTGTATWSNIAPGATGASTPFRFQTSPAFVPGTIINFTLNVTTAQGPFTFNFTMPSGTFNPPAVFSATGPVPIPDNNPVGADLNVTVSGLTAPIAKVRVAARITHTWDGDLALSIRGPDGTTVQLSNNRGSSGDNFGTDCPTDDGDDTIFDDAAATAIAAGAAPFVGSFRPEQPLSAFNGKTGPAANGTWVFHVVDNAGQDVGNIECVTITIDSFSTVTGTGPCAPPGPTLNINDATVTEGATNANFTVTLSPPAASAVTVQFATANGTATAGSDYTSTSGTLTFAAGVTSQPVAVPVLADTLDEANETFTVNLTSPTGPAAIGDGTGLGTINDDDPSPALSISDVSLPEGTGASPTAFQFNATLSAVSGQAVTVQFATADGTATQPGDYAQTTGMLTFNPGTTTLPVFVNVVADPLDEPNETFNVNLSSPTAATIGNGTGVGTITDDDISYYAVTPCRIVDTRGGPPLAAGSTTNYTVTGGTCAVPADAAAVMINVTVVQQTDFGNLRVYPNGVPEPTASTINFVVGRTRANNAIVPVGTGGQLRVKVDMAVGSTGTTQLILDAFGYFK